MTTFEFLKFDTDRIKDYEIFMQLDCNFLNDKFD